MSDAPPPPSGEQPPPPPAGPVPPPPPPPPGNLAPPPGYVAYGSAPTPMTRVSRVKGLATAIMIVVGIAGVGGVVGGLLQSSISSDAEDFLAGNISESEFQDNLLSSTAFSAVAGVATIAAMVLVMIWMYRITANIRAFGHRTTWHPLFAIFGWMLPPFIIYVIPLLMLREQWSKSAPPETPGVVSTSKKENPMLWLWWVCYGLLPLAALAMSADSVFGGFGDTTTEAVAERLADTNQMATIFSSIGGLVAAIAWILFVRQLTTRHRAMTGEN